MREGRSGGELSFDLLIRGGRVIDPASGRDGLFDVGVADGRIARVEPSLAGAAAAHLLDASGLVVTPGLIDFHVHVFAGQDLGVPAARVGQGVGVTTLVDAGSAGAHLFEAFRAGYLEPATERVLAFVNIASIGLTSILLAGEAEQLRYCSVEACRECLETHADVLVGVKVRAAENTVGANGVRPLERALEAASGAGVRTMVHVGGPPPPLADILALLRPGDIVTHCCTGLGNRLADDGGGLRDDVAEARERGVFFDVGHGGGSFDVRAASALLEAGFLPDTISSDAHSYSLEAVGDLPTVLSKFLALGLSLEQVIERATVRPASLLGRPELGTLAEGAVADVAVFEVRRAPVTFTDTAGMTFAGEEQLVPRHTVQGGELVRTEGARL